MTKSRLIKKLRLSESDFKAIEDTIKKSEKRTSGEIAIAVTAESSDYAFWELLASAGTTFALFLCLFPLSPQIYSWLEDRLWIVRPWHLTLFFISICFTAEIILYFLYNIPLIDSIVIPQKIKDKAVSDRAMRYFAESGVYCTDNHSGILIFISYFEKQVRIIADKGISVRITDDLWNLISDELSENLQKGNACDAFVHAIEKCGQLLEENFPAGEDKKDQLLNRLAVIGD